MSIKVYVLKINEILILLSNIFLNKKIYAKASHSFSKKNRFTYKFNNNFIFT